MIESDLGLSAVVFLTQNREFLEVDGPDLKRRLEPGDRFIDGLGTSPFDAANYRNPMPCKARIGRLPQRFMIVGSGLFQSHQV